jgi:transcriptional accessory protein Tex/SPT6
MVASVLPSPSHAAVFLLLIGVRLAACSAFRSPTWRPAVNNNNAWVCSPILRMADGDRAADYGGGDAVVLYCDGTTTEGTKKPPRPLGGGISRWDSLNPKIKSRIVREAQERAIRAKKRREPSSVKKRRLYDQYREMQVQSKRDRHVERPNPVKSKSRTKLSDISPGDVLPGRVISLTRFGAYVDVNTEVDGLLHVSQITRDEFVDHPRGYLSPGEGVEVRVVRADPESKKLQLTMLPEEVLEEENVMGKHEVNEDEDDRIQLDEIEVDDELWGEIRRVTDFGAYVEIGMF